MGRQDTAIVVVIAVAVIAAVALSRCRDRWPAGRASCGGLVDAPLPGGSNCIAHIPDPYANGVGPREGLCPSLDRFEAGPQNIGLYDSPYTNYPSYEGRSATQWDADRRCMASCSQSPCTIWCR